MQTTATDLTALYEHTGPFASVYLPMPSRTEDARSQLEIRRRDAEAALDAAGGESALLQRAAIGAADHPTGATLAVVGVGAEPLVARPLDIEGPDLVRVDSLPTLTPFLREEQDEVNHIVVLIDRTGAEIVVRAAGTEYTDAVEGDTEHLSRIGGGGWSHRRMQQRAENTWERNATLVAADVATAARQTGARLVFAAGDERALGFLAEHLPEDVVPLLHIEPHRPDGGADPMTGIDDALRAQLASVAALEQAHLVDRFAEASGRNEAADGAEATLAALTEARVEVLLVRDDLADDRRAWFAHDEPVAATRPGPIQDLGRKPVEGRLADVAVRSALLTDAAVCLLADQDAEAPTDGIGALTRWS